MRSVRPTVKVVRQLPRGQASPDLAARLSRFDAALLEELYTIDHPICEAARNQVFEGHRCQLHKSSTKSAKTKVFEIEENASGWRGAVILDSFGDPWLVHVDKHDRFHRTAADVLAKAHSADYMPSSLDYRMREREDYALAVASWETDLAGVWLRLIDAITTGSDASETLEPCPQPPDQQHDDDTATVARVCMDVSATHDPVDADISAATAHLSDSMVDVTIAVRGAMDEQTKQSVMGVAARLFGSGPQVETTYLPRDSGVVFNLNLTKADLIVIHDRVTHLSSDTHRAGIADDGPADHPMTLQHYVREAFMADSLVLARPVRALCDTWFVITKDGQAAQEAGLPICPECERRRPTAQAVLNLFLPITPNS